MARKLKILTLSDPISGLIANNDSGLGLSREALKRGHTLYWATDQDIALSNGTVLAHAQKWIKCDEDQYPELEEPKLLDAREFDVVWIRKDPPFDDRYKSACWLLELIENDVRILNPPRVLLSYHEKLIPYLALSRGVLKIDEVIPTFMPMGGKIPIAPGFPNGETITKPWLGHGGRDVETWHSTEEARKFIASQSETIMVQPLIEGIKTRGDMRAYFINGECLGHFIRIPQEGTVRSNIASGGKPVLRPLNEKESNMIARLGPFLRELEIYIAGVDILDGHVSEVNITAPTSFALYKRLTGIDLRPRFVDLTEELAY